MTFINDNGDTLNFDGEFAITKRSISLFDGTVRGDTSINFSLDNNSVNRKILGYNGPMMINQIAATKQAFNRVKDGNIIDRGFIVIQEDTDTLNCYYISGNSDWIQGLDIYITDLDYTGVTSSRNYTVKMNDTYVNASTGQTYGIVFPLVDWWSNYERGLSVYNSTSIMYSGKFSAPGTVGGVAPSSPEFYSKPVFDFYPCFYLSTILDEISCQTDIKINGTLLQDGLYKSLIITPTNGLIGKPNRFGPIKLTGQNQVIASIPSNYTSFTEVNDNNNLVSSGIFTSDRVCTVKSTITVNSFTSTPTFSIKKNGSNVYGPTLLTSAFTYISYVDVLKGDTLTIVIDSATTTVNLNWTIEEQSFVSYDNYLSPSDFLPKIKCVDLIKCLISTFGCVSSFDNNSKTLTLNIIGKYKLEDAEDWSNYYISHVNNYTSNTATHNYVNLKQLSFDNKITTYNNVNNTPFGSLDVVTNNNLIDKNIAINLPFASLFFDKEIDNSYQARVPLVELTDNQRVAFTSITDSGAGYRLFDTSASGVVFERGQIVRVINSSGVDFGLFRIGGTNSTKALLFFPFYGTDTGFIITQTIKYNEVGFCLLTNSTINASDLYPGYSTFGYVDASTSVDNRKATNDYAYFTKFKTGLNIDNNKNNLALENPNIPGVFDPDIKNIYQNRISNIFNNPIIKATMLLPESIYQSYKYDKFVYLKTKDLIGYFLVDTIDDFVDSSTPVEVNFYML